MSLVISTDNNKLEIDFIHQFLTKSYWAEGRTKEEVIISMKNCLNFGVYLNRKQIGFARVLTDYTVFAYLMDVFIIETHRGKGYSKQLMKTVMQHPDLQRIKRWILITKDAHGLYEQFGFKAIEDPSRIMGKLVNN